MLDLEKIYSTDETLLITDRGGAVVSRLYLHENRVSVGLDAPPDHVKNAFLAAEDARFYSHPGFDLIRIAGAALNDLKAGSYVEGASTITQQLIKLTHLSSEKTLNRKVDEAILSYRLEQLLTKDEILTCYLNRVYFGGGWVVNPSHPPKIQPRHRGVPMKGASSSRRRQGRSGKTCSCPASPQRTSAVNSNLHSFFLSVRGFAPCESLGNSGGGRDIFDIWNVKGI